MTVPGRAPLWLFLPLLLAGCVGLIAAAMMATIALGIGVDGSHDASGYAAFVAAPIVVVALLGSGTVALWRGRLALGVALFVLPACLGFGLLWLSTLR